jgi:hypothetical protein
MHINAPCASKRPRVPWRFRQRLIDETILAGAIIRFSPNERPRVGLTYRNTGFPQTDCSPTAVFSCDTQQPFPSAAITGMCHLNILPGGYGSGIDDTYYQNGRLFGTECAVARESSRPHSATFRTGTSRASARSMDPSTHSDG